MSRASQNIANADSKRLFGVFRFSAVELLVTLGLLFITAPFIENLPKGDLIEGLLLTLVMVFAVLAVGGRRRTLITAALLVTPALIGKWADHVWPDLISPAIFPATAVVFFVYVVAHLLHFVLRAPRVDTNVLCAGLAGFLMLGLLWMLLYVLVGRLDPRAFALPTGPDGPASLDAFNAFYFSFVTLCTVGFGDITPVSKAAKMLTVVEGITGLFYVTVLISRLVSVYSSQAPVTESKEANHP